MIIDVNAYLGPFAFRSLRHNTAAGLLALMDRRVSAGQSYPVSGHHLSQPAAGQRGTVAAQIRSHQDRLTGFAVSIRHTRAGATTSRSVIGDSGCEAYGCILAGTITGSRIQPVRNW